MPSIRREYAGLIVSLARQEWPDLSGFTEPEVVWRLKKRHHAGLIVVSPTLARVDEVLAAYAERFRTEFMATLPAAARAQD
jgi:hypothetical protein